MLIDDLRRSSRIDPSRRALLEQADVVIDASDVGRYLHEHLGHYAGRTLPQIVPCAAPLGRITWVEWHDGFLVRQTTTSVLGSLICHTWLEGDAQPPVWIWPDRSRDALGFELACLQFRRDPLGLEEMITQIGIALDRDGALINMSFERDDHTPDETEQEATGAVLVVPLLAVSFAHCKNVTLVDHRPARQQARAALRAGDPAPTVYKTLDIRPMRRVFERAGAAPLSPAGTVVLHQAIGHFKTYSPERPLLGKVPGRFWWGPQLRGNPARGAVQKRYRSMAPEG